MKSSVSRSVLFPAAFLLVASTAAITAAFGFASDPQTRDDAASVLGAGIPASTTPFVIAALVSVEGAGLEKDCFLYISRKTFNRLRDECGGSADCDAPGLQLRVTAGADAVRWNIPSGAQLSLTELRNGVPVPESIVAGRRVVPGRGVGRVVAVRSARWWLSGRRRLHPTVSQHKGERVVRSRTDARHVPVSARYCAVRAGHG